jgi:hypothetical protein
MNLQLDDPALIPDLRQHFERSGFVTNRLDDETVEVWQTDPRSDDHEREAIQAHLAIWRAVHEDADVEIVE